MSSGPQTLGLCNDNLAGCAEYVNSAQRRLLYAKEAGDEGWWGTWAEVAFNGVSRSAPYITLPRDMARIEAIDVCDRTIALSNQFLEYLQFGNGRLPKICPQYQNSCIPHGYGRDNSVTFADQTVSPCIARVYSTSSADANAAKRVLIQGLDATGETIYSQDGLYQVQGQFVTLDSVFQDAPLQYSKFTGIQKDITVGQVQIFQVDPATGSQRLLLTMEPGETTAWYRRYYLNNLPKNCFNGNFPETNVRCTGIVKMELIPVKVDTDYLLIQNLEAIIEECVSRRLSRMDDSQSKQLSLLHHRNAISLLNSEITHYMGKQSPAVNFAPFGSARLERRMIGTML